MLIKICGITDAGMARFAASCGADFIGIVFAPHSKRFVSYDKAEEIARATKEAGAEPVALFVDTPASEIEMICDKLSVQLVQAYGLNRPLAERFRRIHINTLDAQLNSGDFLLMESDAPGSGKKIDSFMPPKQSPWILAGGLSPDNVREQIALYHPDGVDVSTGVEKNGKKDKELIQRFIEEVRHE